MAEETNIKTPSEVAASFGRQEQEIGQEVGAIDIDEELIKMRQRFEELEQQLRDAQEIAVRLQNFVNYQQQIIQNNERNIDVIDTAIKNSRGATDATKVSFGADGSLIIDGGGVSAFSGTAYMAGRRVDGLNSDNTKLWVKVDVSNGTVTEEAGPPSSPFPPNEEWYEKSKTSGDIHVTRL